MGGLCLQFVPGAPLPTASSPPLPAAFTNFATGSVGTADKEIEVRGKEGLAKGQGCLEGLDRGGLSFPANTATAIFHHAGHWGSARWYPLSSRDGVGVGEPVSAAVWWTWVPVRTLPLSRAR